MQTSVLSLHRSGSGQTTLLPLHRSGSGQKKQQMKRLTPEQAQLIAFLSFLFLLVLYIVYNVRTLMSAAKARQMEQAALLSQQTVPAALEPLSALPSANLSRFKAERGFEAEKITHVLDAKLAFSEPNAVPVPNNAAASSTGSAVPGAFSAWRHGTRRDGQQAGGGGGGGKPPVQGVDQDPGSPGSTAAGSNSGNAAGGTHSKGGGSPPRQAGNHEHAPIQVRDSSWRTSGVQMGAATKASRDQQGTSQQGSIQQGGDKPLLRTATDRTNWLVTELQAHYKKACVDSRVAAGGVPEQACRRLLDIGQKLGSEQRSSTGARFVAAMQSQAFPLIELVRQSIGAAPMGSELVLNAVAVMKELSNLGHMDISEAGVTRSSNMFGSDEFLDAHVGSHFEDAGIESGPVVESPRQSSSKESNKVPWGQGVSAQRRKEQREAQRAHQQISVGSVGMNKALVASPNTKGGL